MSAIAVALGDIHFADQSLELASSSLRQARQKAHELGVPLVINGDLLDGKGAIRAVCANRIIQILSEPNAPVRTIINTGNHDKIHEKSQYHSLNFLRPYAEVIDTPTYDVQLKSWIIPYFNDGPALEALLKTIPEGSRLFVHQGVIGAEMGAYAVDRTSLPRDAYASFRVIGSHYHKRQDIKCGRPRKGAVGLFSYLGSPYTITFAEAADGPKGYNIVHDNGLLELIPTNLRKHVKLDIELSTVASGGLPPEAHSLKPEDLLWVVLHGPYSELEKVNKKDLGQRLIGHSSFRFDKVPDEAKALAVETAALPPVDVLHKLIEATSESAEQKSILKALAKEILA